jgi:DinB superfamily
MTVPSQIANAAYIFGLNDGLFKKCFEGLTAEEWLRRPNDSSNHLLWIVGHVIWARGAAVKFLGSAFTTPWLPLFARGTKLDDTAQYPTPQEIKVAWHEVSARLTAALEGASEDALSKPGPERIPNPDGKISGVVNFLANHETYHLGQAAYLRCWMGHEGVAG